MVQFTEKTSASSREKHTLVVPLDVNTMFGPLVCVIMILAIDSLAYAFQSSQASPL